MSNWTEETWNFNSLDLSTYAHGVSQVVEGFPSRRGANRGRGYRHGTQWRRKFYDQRVISLSMFVQDRDANDTDPGTAQARRAQLNENVDTIKKAFAPTRELKTLTRVLRMDAGLETRTAEAECVNVREFTKDNSGFYIVRLVADFLLPDPFFYGPSATQQTISALSTPTAITNDGTVDAGNASIVITGGAGGVTNPVLTNSTLGVNFTYTGTIGSSDAVTFDVTAGTATHDVSGDVTTSVTHSGDPLWMILQPGSNTLELTASSGAASVTVDYSPPYI